MSYHKGHGRHSKSTSHLILKGIQHPDWSFNSKCNFKPFHCLFGWVEQKSCLETSHVAGSGQSLQRSLKLVKKLKDFHSPPSPLRFFSRGACAGKLYGSVIMAELLLARVLIEWSLLKFFCKKWASLLKYDRNFSSVKFYGTSPRNEKPLKITKSVF